MPILCPLAPVLVLWLPLGVPPDPEACRESQPPNEPAGPTKSNAFWEIQSVWKNRPLCSGNVSLLWLVAQGSQIISEQDAELSERVDGIHRPGFLGRRGLWVADFGFHPNPITSQRRRHMWFALSLLWSPHLWNGTVPAASQLYRED